MEQTNKNFKWLIVDDGSKDNTKDLINSWISENEIEIKYLKQENSGKMQAHNVGVLNTETPLFLCVDSDDYLSSNAVQVILESYSNWKDRNDIAGVVAYKVSQDGNPLGNYFPQGIKESGLNDLYRKGFKGDATLVFKTAVIKNFLFPKFNEEKFLTEDYVYCQIDQKYKYVVLPESITFCEYLSDGYSQNILKIMNNNPVGMAEYYNLKSKYAKTFLESLKYVSGYVCYSKIAKIKHAFKNAKCKFKYFLAYPIGVLLYLKRKNIK